MLGHPQQKGACGPGGLASRSSPPGPCASSRHRHRPRRLRPPRLPVPCARTKTLLTGPAGGWASIDALLRVRHRYKRLPRRAGCRHHPIVAYGAEDRQRLPGATACWAYHPLPRPVRLTASACAGPRCGRQPGFYAGGRDDRHHARRGRAMSTRPSIWSLQRRRRPAPLSALALRPPCRSRGPSWRVHGRSLRGPRPADAFALAPATAGGLVQQAPGARLGMTQGLEAAAGRHPPQLPLLMRPLQGTGCRRPAWSSG